jgi:catechol 2,3-dioxygenase
VTERHGGYPFLSFGDHHHDDARPAVSLDAPDSGNVGLYHAAVEVDDHEALAAVKTRLEARNVDVSPVEHGISSAVYFDDPAGTGLEASVDTGGTVVRHESAVQPV